MIDPSRRRESKSASLTVLAHLGRMVAVGKSLRPRFIEVATWSLECNWGREGCPLSTVHCPVASQWCVSGAIGAVAFVCSPDRCKWEDKAGTGNGRVLDPASRDGIMAGWQ